MTEKTRQPTLTIPQKFAIMSMVRDQLPGAELTDTEFAQKCADVLGRSIHPSTITHYREGFGIPKYTAPTAAELRAKLREAQRELALRDTPVNADGA